MSPPARIRPRLAPTVVALWRRYPHARVAVIVLAMTNLALGVVLSVGGPTRVSAASFASIRDTGGPIVWGTGLALAGAAMLLSPLVSRRGVAYALAVAALAHLFLAGGFLVAALDRPDAALTGPIIYVGFSACHATQYLLHRRPVPLAR